MVVGKMTKANIGLVTVGSDEKETRGDLGQRAPRHAGH